MSGARRAQEDEVEGGSDELHSPELAQVEERLVAAVIEEGEPGALSEEERLELERAIRAELEREHQQRLERLHRRQETARAQLEERRVRERHRQVALLKDAVRLQFYRERGYHRVEENGRERWVTTEELAARQRSRARVNTRAVGARVHRRFRMLPLYLLLALVAMAIGAFLVR